MLQGLIYPASWLIKVMSVITLAFLGNNGITEIRGNQLQYSKFWNVGSEKSTFKVSGRTGFFMVYSPAFLFGVASFWIFPNQESLRFIMLRSALSIHFFKRTLEVLFVHKYSGPMFVDVAAMISISYFIQTWLMIYAQHQTQGLQEPRVDLKYAGVMIFLAGLSGNLYHHCLLSKLREEGNKEYKIPTGGLFNLVICPHYLFEALVFVGVSCIAQTWYAFSVTLGTTILLVGRSYGTRRWYLSKFEDFPKDMKAMIPFVF